MKRIMGLLMILILIHTSAAQFKTVPGVGWEGQGAGVVMTNLDSNPRPEMILMAYDNPAQMNSFRYKIGWNLNSAGDATSWDANYKTVSGVGWEGQGADAAFVNLDSNGRPEMIVMAYDNPAQDNNFRYKIGWNLNSAGDAASWDANYKTVSGVGWEGQGAGLILTNLDSNIRPEMIVMAYDNPAQDNNFRYRIGWNLNSAGVATSWDANYKMIPGVGWEGQGAGALITNLDSNPKPEMIVMAYDNPGQMNSFRYKVGWNLNSAGVATSWDSGYQTVPGVGWEGQGAGIAAINLNDDPRPEMIFMAYDNPAQSNTFRYQIVSNAIAAKRIRLELDKLSSVNWPPASITRSGATHTLQSIYSLAGIELTPIQNEGTIADLHPGQGYTLAELDSFRSAHMNSPPASGSGIWHMYGALVTRYTDPNVLGVMFDTGSRRAFAVFTQSATPNEYYLRTTAHELGHALNLEHSDSSDWPTTGNGRDIMSQTGNLASDWNYGWSASSLCHFYTHPEDRWRPNSGVSFENCH
ncbi:MAG TPA: hypothetical protein PLI05_00345 [Methanotrichaceae archaeon]|nr:MAG: hypothetical protein A4E47_00508 [Methanosaeta sp. PtaU1.Bin028]HOT06192.1 hypothetical protein [Methanotrichaceae archaeon]HQF15499.1 hypothetical protein [Methanotrichaceae archaeon]HQI90234.1 hypothetical protein [Methanotrichaceae archaeon]HQJ27797.1 hypothetical protein [Methanotrichaceae archaeon]